MRHGALSLVLSLTVGACASSNLQTDQNLNSNQSQNSNHPRDIDPNQNDMGFDSYGRPGDPLSFKDGSGNREGLTDFVERDSYLPKNSANTPVMDPPIGRQ